MDYLQYLDDLTADRDPDDDDPDDPAPYRTVCGGEVGIFVRRSPYWQPYRTTAEGSVELFDPGHGGWRGREAPR